MIFSFFYLVFFVLILKTTSSSSSSSIFNLFTNNHQHKTQLFQKAVHEHFQNHSFPLPVPVNDYEDQYIKTMIQDRQEKRKQRNHLYMVGIGSLGFIIGMSSIASTIFNKFSLKGFVFGHGDNNNNNNKK